MIKRLKKAFTICSLTLPYLTLPYLTLPYLTLPSIAYAVVDLQTEIQAVSMLTCRMRGEHSEADSVIVVGDTGSGKSTLITYLANRPLTAKLQRSLYVLETEFPIDDFRIHSETGAGTTSPVPWYDAEHNTVYWDCPGFDDAGGEDANIVNAFAIHELFKEPSRVKLVLTIKSVDLNEVRLRKIGSLLKNLTSVFENAEQLKQSLSLIVTASVSGIPGGSGVTSDPGQVFRDAFLTADRDDQLKIPRVKDLIGFLADNATTRIAFFPYPTRLGSYGPESRVSILASIRSSRCVENPRTRIVLPSSSEARIRTLSNEINALIVSHITGDLSQKMNWQCENMVDNPGSKKARDLKSDFARMATRLREIGFDVHSARFVDSLQSIVQDDPLLDLKARIASLDFFAGILGDLTIYRTHLWRKALDPIIQRVSGLSTAPETVEERRGGHCGSWREGESSRNYERGGSNMFGMGKKTYNTVTSWTQCEQYVIQEKIATIFPCLTVGGWPEAKILVDDWYDTDRRSIDRHHQSHETGFR